MSHIQRLPAVGLSLVLVFLLSLLHSVTTRHNAVAATNWESAPAAPPQSDDFDGCVLNTDLWTFVDPLGDSLISTNGTQAVISMLAGSEHDLWENKNQAPRLLQNITNEDFSIEVKFESAVSQRFQTQGVIIEQDSNNFLRFDFYHNGSAVVLFAASFSGGVPTIRINQELASIPPAPEGYFMRVIRSGNSWLQRYSFTGNEGDWVDGASFDHAIIATRAGLFGGNVSPDDGQPAPAHTLIADYFFNTAAPISPEDDNSTETLTVSIEGDGTVSPESGNYPCGEQTVSATPANGWIFAGWSGALSGFENPTTLFMNGDLSVTATFIQQGSNKVYLPLTSQ